jgi:inorganic pyrophosphatase
MSLSKVKIGTNAPLEINVVIEIPKGSHHKYEYDDQMDTIKLDRVLNSAVYYPTNYGFIPETLSEDGDHLDVLVLITDRVFPGCVLTVKPIGMLDMEDQAGQDWKIIAVASNDPKMNNIRSLDDVDEHFKKEIEVFFRNYKELENKKVEVKKWLPKEAALTQIKLSMQKYLETKR